MKRFLASSQQTRLTLFTHQIPPPDAENITKICVREHSPLAPDKNKYQRTKNVFSYYGFFPVGGRLGHDLESLFEGHKKNNFYRKDFALKI
jgi:hypothetical protein